MRYLIFLIPLFIVSCSFNNDSESSENWGALALQIKIVDTAGQTSSTEEAFKNNLTATLFDSKDNIVRLWDNLNQLPSTIPLTEGSYYLVIESKGNPSPRHNAITHYAKTDLIQINDGNNQTIALTFEDSLTPPSFNDFFSSSQLSEESIF